MKKLFLLCSFILLSVAVGAQTEKKDSAVIIRYAPPVEVVEDNIDSGQDEQVFVFTEQMPQYPGGMDKYQEFIIKNVKYPDKARQKGIQGTVYVSFIVDEKGNHYNEQVLKSPDPLLAQEALRIVKMMPAWEPGKQNGKTVKVKITMPIKFLLEDDDKDGGVWIEKKR